MRIARRQTSDGPRLAALAGDDLVDLDTTADLTALLADDGALAEAAETALRLRRQVTPMAEAELLAPLQPATFRDFSTFYEHVNGISGGRVPPEFFEIPTFYFSNPYAITGPHADIAVPPGSTLFDFELEVGAVIGRPGRDLTVDEAGAHIAGFVIVNDFSARDTQFHEMRMGLGPAKGKDSATSLGTLFVTVDELAEHRSGLSYDLRMEVRVNDRLIGGDTLASMSWTFEALVAYAARGTEVRPGDLLGSGTCQNGCLAELWGRHGRDHLPPLAPGDVVTTTVTGLGETRNRIVPGPAAHPIVPWRTA
ncbi:fumarylacetoacetate hydrolase family protein [Planosporangium mesophilum]|uniref:Hydroxylase n=1 Tax=Planosporangium mesophilum TaxID=689768 RepID=A0A8J3TC41_9ACTN|nr:fumarylacetoacetate hydrolase family protein [Planosporangium mesophilum]NJC83857.1 fumarylacetoacetate hydrolase family protein [Planosporangium mesophilum]GII22786.1 hydroxylase [Planosporangium mesophilum]